MLRQLVTEVGRGMSSLLIVWFPDFSFNFLTFDFLVDFLTLHPLCHATRRRQVGLDPNAVARARQLLSTDAGSSVRKQLLSLSFPMFVPSLSW